ncbi:glucose sorbosone dehydrogenase [Pseudomonas aeruginosa]|nr:glucose sorbosone dehydrogenase [Pseudomonas aeruginosa]
MKDRQFTRCGDGRRGMIRRPLGPNLRNRRGDPHAVTPDRWPGMGPGRGWQRRPVQRPWRQGPSAPGRHGRRLRALLPGHGDAGPRPTAPAPGQGPGAGRQSQSLRAPDEGAGPARPAAARRHHRRRPAGAAGRDQRYRAFRPQGRGAQVGPAHPRIPGGRLSGSARFPRPQGQRYPPLGPGHRHERARLPAPRPGPRPAARAGLERGDHQRGAWFPVRLSLYQCQGHLGGDPQGNGRLALRGGFVTARVRTARRGGSATRVVFFAWGRRERMPGLSLNAILLSAVALLAPSAEAVDAGRHDSELGAVEVTPVVGGLAYPWAVAFLPDNQGMLVTERPGSLRFVSPEGQLSAPLEGVPRVFASGQGGLLDVALSPGFAEDRLVYLTYAEAGEDGRAGTAAGRGRLSADKRRLEGFHVIFRQLPKLSSGHHFGSRLVFDGKGHLFIALGENNQRSTSQDLDKLQGKIVRLYPDGGVPKDNPFVGRADARPEIWSYGHRNQQGAALNPWTGRLWTHEHGPRGGDEINIPQAGGNYGWPLATHGINYTLLPIPEARGKAVEGTEAPHHVWEKSPAISGMAFYDAQRFPAWQHNLFIGALATQELIRLQLDGDRIVHEERLLGDLGVRIRDVRQGPEGYLYLLTDQKDGQLLRLGLAR